MLQENKDGVTVVLVDFKCNQIAKTKGTISEGSGKQGLWDEHFQLFLTDFR